VVDCRQVVSGQRALNYLAPFIFRVTITNRRIASQDNDPTGGCRRLCTAPVLKFIRCFLEHVLPKGFVKARYYDFFSSGQRTRLRQVAAWLKPPAPPKERSREEATPTLERTGVVSNVRATAPSGAEAAAAGHGEQDVLCALTFSSPDCYNDHCQGAQEEAVICASPGFKFQIEGLRLSGFVQFRIMRRGVYGAAA
jgi:hypothetical protein